MDLAPSRPHPVGHRVHQLATAAEDVAVARTRSGVRDLEWDAFVKGSFYVHRRDAQSRKLAGADHEISQNRRVQRFQFGSFEKVVHHLFG